MQHFRDNEKKTIENDRQSAILGFISAKFSYVIYLCESLHFVQYAWSSYFALILRCLNITKLLKFKMTARSPFQNCLLPKGYQLID